MSDHIEKSATNEIEAVFVRAIKVDIIRCVNHVSCITCYNQLMKNQIDSTALRIMLSFIFAKAMTSCHRQSFFTAYSIHDSLHFVYQYPKHRPNVLYISSNKVKHVYCIYTIYVSRFLRTNNMQRCLTCISTS